MPTGQRKQSRYARKQDYFLRGEGDPTTPKFTKPAKKAAPPPPKKHIPTATIRGREGRMQPAGRPVTAPYRTPPKPKATIVGPEGRLEPAGPRPITPAEAKAAAERYKSQHTLKISSKMQPSEQASFGAALAGVKRPPKIIATITKPKGSPAVSPRGQQDSPRRPTSTPTTSPRGGRSVPPTVRTRASSTPRKPVGSSIRGPNIRAIGKAVGRATMQDLRRKGPIYKKAGKDIGSLAKKLYRRPRI
jgi:hypothetical protein